MSLTLFNRYIWLIDTIRSHGTITREQLNSLWKRSAHSQGDDLPRRTFYNYRTAIEEIFKITIEYNPTTYEYYIDDGGDAHTESVTDWMLSSASISNSMTDAREISHRIFLEDVPSARFHLSNIIKAIKESKCITFTYAPYTRSNPTPGVVIEPYFLKLWRQRWYVTGRNVKEDTIKTYAHDRMSDLTITAQPFTIPDEFDTESYFKDSFGIMDSHAEPRKVVIRTDPRQAKYFRALPLHSSQTEMVHDEYSVFTYNLKLTPDFVQELLSYGPKVEVMEPPELKAMIVTSLREALSYYE